MSSTGQPQPEKPIATESSTYAYAAVVVAVLLCVYYYYSRPPQWSLRDKFEHLSLAQDKLLKRTNGR